MPLVCSRCRRVNPPDAVFCYHDGVPLNGQGRAAPGRPAFGQPFVFPSGRRCLSFDELAVACQQEWTEARGLLAQGHFETFFGSLGRPDLASAAAAAAQWADSDRGLDELLDKIPNSVLQPPRLYVQPQDVNLGTMALGTDERFDLHLENRGMKLVRGSVASDAPWLTLGDGVGSPRKVFQFADGMVIPVQVQGARLRAGAKPLEARLTIDSNGGSVIIPVRVEVPARPFPEGVLAGAATPRQLAEKAREAAREAAGLFEDGAVARWYRDNGWSYPVQGPTADGVGAVQQYFEALGLSTPPKVDVPLRQVALAGAPGERVEFGLEVRTDERRPVYARAASNQAWLKPGRATLQGRAAVVPLVVPVVPDRPGETLHAQATIVANGNQRFTVNVTLTVSGARAAAPVATPRPVAIPVGIPYQPPPASAPPARPRRRKETPVAAGPSSSWGKHLTPLVLLFCALGVVFVIDLLRRPVVAVPPEFVELPIDPEPYVRVQFHDREEEVYLGTGGIKPENAGPEENAKPAIWEPSLRFGLISLREPGAGTKRLTFEERGFTNNVCVRLDGREMLFGERPFRLREGGRSVGDWPGRWKERSADNRRGVWVWDDERVQVTQTVDLVAGEQSRRYDTVLVRYLIENLDGRAHRVGLRFLLDTYIGGNDGVPFTIPGARELCDTTRRFDRPEDVPDYLQALERDDLSDPGTIAHVQLRLGGRTEAPSRVTLGSWPNVRLNGRDARCLQEKTLWDVPVLPIRTLSPADSSVTMYWEERPLEAGGKREVGFAYGLGAVTAAGGDASARLGLSLGGRFQPGGEFTLTALVRDPKPGETLTLDLPEGFRLVQGEATQPVPPVPAGATRPTSPVTWKLRAGGEGAFTLKVRSSAGAAQSQNVRIRTQSIFD